MDTRFESRMAALYVTVLGYHGVLNYSIRRRRCPKQAQGNSKSAKRHLISPYSTTKAKRSNYPDSKARKSYCTFIPKTTLQGAPKKRALFVTVLMKSKAKAPS